LHHLLPLELRPKDLALDPAWVFRTELEQLITLAQRRQL
jgi:hypothetical protein